MKKRDIEKKSDNVRKRKHVEQYIDYMLLKVGLKLARQGP
jgi:hypothetical protein